MYQITRNRGRELFIILTSLLMSVTSQTIDGSINFDIKPSNETTVTLHQFINLTQLYETITVTVNSPNDIGFFIIQLHSFSFNLTISYTPDFKTRTYVNGTNIGLVQMIKDNENIYKFYVKSQSNNSTILASVTTYPIEAPIPGGCSMTFDTELAPYQLVQYTPDIIRVDVQEAASFGHVCEENVVKLEMYHMFLEGWNFHENLYFNSLINMLHVDSIKKYGRKVPEPQGYTNLRRYYNNYAGVGSVYVAIATFGNFSSAYVPTISYGCNITQEATSCSGSRYYHWIVIGPILAISASLILIIGHIAPQITSFFLSIIIGIELVYFPISQLLGRDAMYAAVPVGIVFAISLMILLVKVDLSHSFNALVASYIVASMLFFSSTIGDVTLFRNNWYFWSIFIGIIIIIMTVNICTSFVYGGLPAILNGTLIYAIMVNYYWSGILYYIVLNTFRRATVEYFSLAVIDPPLQIHDHVSMYIALCVAFIIFKCKCTAGESSEERTPLLG